MNFPRFWARGSSGDFQVWRWSFGSQAEAQTLADAAARQLAERFGAGHFPPKRGGYYPDRPFREEVLREIPGEEGALAAVITRNSYGCDILNTSGAMFVDIDLPEPRKSGGFFKRLFGAAEPVAADCPRTQAIARIEAWTRRNSDWGWRIYRTRSGLRLLATQALIQAESPVAAGVFEALGCDPLYRKLCQTQKCFRARLTPKPWRCGIYQKPGRWPWLDPKQQRRFEKWQEKYRAAIAGWATCQFLRAIGNPEIHAQVRPVIQLHDAATRAETGLPLA